MLETPDEIERLQELLDRSAAGAGRHLREIITDERRLSAAGVCALLPGLRLLVVATVTADGRPLAGPVDGFFLHLRHLTASRYCLARAAIRARVNRKI